MMRETAKGADRDRLREAQRVRLSREKLPLAGDGSVFGNTLGRGVGNEV